jgi:hypothetical protein
VHFVLLLLLLLQLLLQHVNCLLLLLLPGVISYQLAPRATNTNMGV